MARRLVIVLGAGASLAEALSHRPSRRASHPPLDGNFFERASTLPKRDREALATACAALGVPDPFGTNKPRMEQFFGDLYYELVRTKAPRADALEAYRALVGNYVALLADTTNWMAQRNRVGRLGRYLASQCSREDVTRLSILTFNHDLIAENILSRARRSRFWCPQVGYGPLEPSSIGSIGPANSQFPDHDSHCDHRKRIQLLKLHGSLNWYVKIKERQPTRRDLVPVSGKQPELYVAKNRAAIVDPVYEPPGSRRPWRLWPQVIPPVFGKETHIANRFESLWSEACERLLDADEVHFAGYSLPPADIFAESAFKRNLRSTKARTFVVMNPDVAVAARIADVVNASEMSWQRVISG